MSTNKPGIDATTSLKLQNTALSQGKSPSSGATFPSDVKHTPKRTPGYVTITHPLMSSNAPPIQVTSKEFDMPDYTESESNKGDDVLATVLE